MQWCSNKLSYDLEILGCTPNKSLTLKFPDENIFKSKDLIRHFIRGYFDGDGCIWNGKRKVMNVKDSTRKSGNRDRIVHNVKFTITGNTSFISSLQLYLSKELDFVITKLNYSKAKETKHICTMEYSGRKNIEKFYHYMYDNASIFGNRKKLKFEEINCALNEKSLSEMRLIAGKPEMVISSQAS